MSVGVMTVGVLSVGEITVGVMTVGVMRRPRFNIEPYCLRVSFGFLRQVLFVAFPQLSCQ
jgi:hypothetical protein